MSELNAASVDHSSKYPIKYRRVVVKVGTSVLTGGKRDLDQAHMVELVRQCAHLYKQGCDVVICTSAAIAVGRSRLNFPTLPNNIVNKQLLASVGQGPLHQTWERLFGLYNIHVGQILLTRADVNMRLRYINARDTLAALLAHRVVPIINENDALAIEEIKVGDNDNLSALVATLVDADLLLMLTDQPGLYTADPRKDPKAALIPEVRKIDDSLKALAGGSVSGLGVGGMATKLQAADVARRAGADVIIASGQFPEAIRRAASGRSVGTLFPALESKLESRKRWILAGPKPAGTVQVDQGAVNALCTKGKSLLPAGIVSIEATFERGDTVAIVDSQQHEFARGITAYSSQELQFIKGCHSDQIAKRLGYTYGSSIVHRNDMILLTEES